MDHIKQRWAQTEMAQPEAAHAASEIDDWQPMPTRHAVVFWLALLGVPALVVVLGLLVALS